MDRFLVVALDFSHPQVQVLGAFGPDTGFYETAEQAQVAAVALRKTGIHPGAEWLTLPAHLITIH